MESSAPFGTGSQEYVFHRSGSEKQKSSSFFKRVFSSRKNRDKHVDSEKKYKKYKKEELIDIIKVLESEKQNRETYLENLESKLDFVAHSVARLKKCITVDTKGTVNIRIGSDSGNKTDLDQNLCDLEEVFEQTRRFFCTENSRLERKLDVSQKTIGRLEIQLGELHGAVDNVMTKLQKENSKVYDKLSLQNNAVLAKLKDLKTTLISNSVTKDDSKDKTELYNSAVLEMRRWIPPVEDVTASLLPQAVRELISNIVVTFAEMPVELETVLCGPEKVTGFYYGNGEMFDNKVAKWLVQWVRSDPSNTGKKLQAILEDLEDRILEAIKEAQRHRSNANIETNPDPKDVMRGGKLAWDDENVEEDETCM